MSRISRTVTAAAFAVLLLGGTAATASADSGWGSAPAGLGAKPATIGWDATPADSGWGTAPK
ncbi:hypothetical protein [Streptomyces sp. NPDC088762]|uniref:hypothetical protein n=1 Tax=Streptomyces sp. NPDC088762 TaxID=3365891 RepID=UPI00382207AF